MDVTFIYQNFRIYSLRTILTHRCPAILKCDDIIKKKRDKKINLTIHLRDNISALTYNVFMEILDFIYTDSIIFINKSIEFVLQILSVANLIPIKRLSWLCEHYLFSILGKLQLLF